MMPSTTSSSQLGRQLWATARDAVDAFLWTVPRRQRPPRSPPPPCPLSHPNIAAKIQPKGPQYSPFSSSARPLHSSKTVPRNDTTPRFAPNNLRRSCTSGSLLLLGLGSHSSSPQAVVTSCTTAVADTALTSTGGSRSTVGRLARQSWIRSIHSGRVGRAESRASAGEVQNKSPNAAGPDAETSPAATSPTKPEALAKNTPTSEPDSPAAAPHGQETLTDSVSKYLHLPHLPKMPHRPTKEELLAAANGFWQRLKVRFKWLSIRSMRPYNADEWGAFLSWLMLGHIVWILVGTTTFFSLIIFMVNTVFAQETLAKWIGDYLTQSAGVTVVFESAIVPKWRDGVITFHNVFVSRRPGQIKSTVRKGSSSNAAAVAAARHVHTDTQAAAAAAAEEEDGNYTQFDVTINTVNVTLSFIKWWNGTGLLKDVEVKGVRGVVDRTSVQWSDEPIDPLSYRHVHQPGDFEIEHFKLEDLLVTVHQPDGFRPFPVSIYSCELSQLRKQWLFHDFLYANHMSGSFDESLFTIHPRQIHGVAAGQGEGLGEPGVWKKFSRIRIDGLKIDHLNRGVEGPFGWIYEGNVDIVADLMFPANEDDSLGRVMADFYDKMEEAVTRNRYIRILDREAEKIKNLTLSSWPDERARASGSRSGALSGPQRPQVQEDSSPPPSLSSSNIDSAGPTPPASKSGPPPRYLVIDLRLHLNDVRAAVPLFTHDISYISQPLVRPIVAYINAKRTYIPISCRIVKRVSDLDGSWTVYDCGMMDDLSAEVYAAFARDVEDQHSRVRRLKKVGFWTLSMVVHALLAGVAGDLI